MKLTKEEIEYIINELLTALSSTYYPFSYKKRHFKDFDNNNIKEILKYPDECFGLKEKELNLIKSILKKLKEQN